MKIFVKVSVISVLLMGAIWPLSGFPQESEKAEQIIAASKAATGGVAWDQIKTLHETGTVTAGGLKGSSDLVRFPGCPYRRRI